MDFVGRKNELAILNTRYTSVKSEFLAIYGRRRIGKTELIDYFINSNSLLSFSVTGAYNAKIDSHLDNFANKLHLSFGIEKPILENWSIAFQKLQNCIEEVRKDENSKLIVFIDELPWLAEMCDNGFKSALSLFWNDFASKRKDIYLIVCGSATSWIIDNVLNDKGSLANRLTAIIHLQPFNLSETKLLLESIGYNKISYKSVLDIYQVFGGVAHYLMLLSPKESLIQNIQRLFFSFNGLLRTEYHHLFASLFSNYKNHEIVLKYLHTTWSGMTFSQLANKKNLKLGSVLKNTLRDLEESGFITKRRRYNQKSRDVLYCVKDPFIFFFTKWINNVSTIDLIQNKNYFQKIFQSQAYKIWMGYAFENICYEHIYEIKESLSIGGVVTESFYWNQKVSDKRKKGAQIDILLKRDDDVINLIECKYHNKEFIITKDYAKQLQNKIDAFYDNTTYKGAVNIVFITAHGIKDNEYYRELMIENVLIDSLF